MLSMDTDLFNQMVLYYNSIIVSIYGGLFMKKYYNGILLGAGLGVICIVGASLRSNEQLSTLYLFSFWFNRVMMGFTFSLLPNVKTSLIKVFIGLFLGFLISFMFYSATDFKDLMGFLAGGVYGLILIFSLQYKKKVH